MSGFHKRHRILWVSKQLVASQERFYAQWSYLYQELNVDFNIRRVKVKVKCSHYRPRGWIEV